MGIQNFSNVFGNAYKPIKDLSEIVRDKRVAIDMHLLLYKAIKALGHQSALTDAAGIPTAGLVNILNFIPKLRKAGVKQIIAVFDNPEPNPWKIDENIKRVLQKEKDAERAADENLGEEEQKRLEGRAYGIDAAVIADAQRLLTMLGVESHIVPFGCEAEQWCGYLARAGKIDVVISDDTDTIGLFGAPRTLMLRTTQSAGKTYKYIVVDLNALLAEYKITFAELVHISISLGCDFCPKTPKIGAGTALTRGKNLKLSPEQEKAMTYIIGNPTGICKGIAPKPDMRAAALWLAEAKGFNYERTAKKLNVPIEVNPPRDIKAEEIKHATNP